ncbi:MAG: CoA-binding protein [Candidatus Hodarchaeota archaeon]
MVSEEYAFEKFDSLFHPKSIAFIGASEQSRFGSMLYLNSFKESKWSSNFYPVNPKHENILGWKCYKSVLDIPVPIDTAYISVKTKIIPHVLSECVKKEIPWVIIFSSGFSETGDNEGLQQEQNLKTIIKGSKTRIIGPNCLGPYNAETGMAFSFSSPFVTPGSISFMSQSGGHLSQLVEISSKRDLRLRYGISFGNQIDLNCIDFLRHYREDEKTQIIAAYLESFGSGHGNEFFLELKKTTRVKPVIIWKGGYTEAGSRAAFSHTGAIASDTRLWNTISKQTGATLVRDNEEFWNIIKTYELLFPKHVPKGRNIGIITPGGGYSVNSTDLFSSHSLIIPELTQRSQNLLNKILPFENVNIKNPVDLGASGFVVDIFLKCIDIVKEDPKIDILIMPLWPHFIYNYVFKRMIKIQKETDKPFAICLPSIADSLEVSKRFSSVKKTLHKERVLYFFTLREAANSISSFCDYIEYLKNQ